MYRSQKLVGDGDQEYSNEKRAVNLRVDGTPSRVSSRARGMLMNAGQHRGSV
jgi:hypothetical protein